MYQVLTTLRRLESTVIGKKKVVITKFRNGLDGIVDVHVQGPKGPVVSVEHSGQGWKAFAHDGTWVQCATLDEVYIWTENKLLAMFSPKRKTKT